MAIWFLHLIFLISLTVHQIMACSPVDPCRNRFQCCLLQYNIGGFIVKSRCTVPAFWYRGRCAKGDKYCARNSDCGSGGVCTGAGLRKWGTCSEAPEPC